MECMGSTTSYILTLLAWPNTYGSSTLHFCTGMQKACLRWGFCCSGHPSSVDALVKYDADTIITGSSDGIIRIINILPNRMLGVLGGTQDLPIERLALSHDQATLASVSHESCLRLWDLSQLAHESEDEEEAAEADTQEGASVSHQVYWGLCCYLPF